MSEVTESKERWGPVLTFTGGSLLMSQVMAGHEINSVPYSAELWLFVSL